MVICLERGADCLHMVQQPDATASSGGDSRGFGGSKDPHFPEWGVTYKAVTPSFDAMLCHFFRFIYWLWTETVVVDQVLL